MAGTTQLKQLEDRGKLSLPPWAAWDLSCAWKRLQAAGNQQLVVASLDDDGGAKVLG